MIPAFVIAASASDPGLVQACGPKGEQSWLCSSVYRITGDSHAADVADALSKPIRIVVVLLSAWILVRITRVFTRRLVKHMSGGGEKLSAKRAGSVGATGPIPPARRPQRAGTTRAGGGGTPTPPAPARAGPPTPPTPLLQPGPLL